MGVKGYAPFFDDMHRAHHPTGEMPQLPKALDVHGGLHHIGGQAAHIPEGDIILGTEIEEALDGRSPDLHSHPAPHIIDQPKKHQSSLTIG